MPVVAVAVADPQHVARARLRDGHPCGGGIVLRLGLVRHRDSHLPIRPRHQTRAVEGVGALRTPHVRAANARERVIHHGALRRNARHRRSRTVRVRAAGLGFGCSRRGCALSLLLLLEQLLRLGVKLRHQLFERRNGGFGLLLDARRLVSLLGGDALLLLKLDFRSLHFGAQVLGFLHHGGIVVVDVLEQVPVRDELLERRGAQHEIEQRGLARAVHAARPLAQPLLQIGDLRIGLVDAKLRVGDRLDGGLVLVERLVIGVRHHFQLVLHRQDACANGLGLGHLVGRRGIGEGKPWPQHRCCAKCGCPQKKRAAIHAARRLCHVRYLLAFLRPFGCNRTTTISRTRNSPPKPWHIFMLRSYYQVNSLFLDQVRPIAPCFAGSVRMKTALQNTPLPFASSGRSDGGRCRSERAV